MKTEISKLLFVGVFLAGLFYFIADDKNSVDILIFNNIEALASGEEEGSEYRCYNSGDIDCYGYKVQYMVDGMDLD